MNEATVRVSYLELTHAPRPAPPRVGAERITAEVLSVDDYVELYTRIGAPYRWDQRLTMPRAELSHLLESSASRIYVLRDAAGTALGLCEFERSHPDIELKNFGVAGCAHGRGLGSWLLATALHEEWRQRPARIWLHTDSWDHPAALHLYRRAGFRLVMVREESPQGL